MPRKKISRDGSGSKIDTLAFNIIYPLAAEEKATSTSALAHIAKRNLLLFAPCEKKIIIIQNT